MNISDRALEPYLHLRPSVNRAAHHSGDGDNGVTAGVYGLETKNPFCRMRTSTRFGGGGAGAFFLSNSFHVFAPPFPHSRAFHVV